MDERSVITIGTAITKRFRKSAAVGVAALVQFALLLAASSQTLKTAATPGVVGQLSSLTQGQQDWPVFGGSPENNQYSSLAQINRSNVKRLQVAWTVRHWGKREVARDQSHHCRWGTLRVHAFPEGDRVGCCHRKTAVEV